MQLDFFFKMRIHLCIILLHLESSKELISLYAAILNQSFMLSCSEGTDCKQPNTHTKQHFYIIYWIESSTIPFLL